MEILFNKGEGLSFWVLGDLYTFKATGKETGGKFTVIEQVIQPGGGPPPHIHQREDELFYITEGHFSFLCGEQQKEMETGSFIYIPNGTLGKFVYFPIEDENNLNKRRMAVGLDPLPDF